jgi:hypothetical protein
LSPCYAAAAQLMETIANDFDNMGFFAGFRRLPRARQSKASLMLIQLAMAFLGIGGLCLGMGIVPAYRRLHSMDC